MAEGMTVMTTWKELGGWAAVELSSKPSELVLRTPASPQVKPGEEKETFHSKQDGTPGSFNFT